MDTANAVPVIGTPLAYGLGFGVLLLVVLTNSWAHSLVTVAHEAGHVVTAVLTFRGHEGFHLHDGGGGETRGTRSSWGPGALLVSFAGYPMPSLLGLGGAATVARGNAGGVLVAALVLLVAAFFVAANPLAIAVTLLATIGTGWAVFAGTTGWRVGVAVVLVWWMLIGGAYWSIRLSRADKSDAARLAGQTLVPRIVWHAIWVAIAVVCLWRGGRLLLAV